MTVNATSPDIVIGAPVSGDSPNFQISIKEISEINSDRQSVRAYSLASLEFFMNQTKEGSNTKVNYTAFLPNQAILSILVSCTFSFHFSLSHP